MGFNKFASNVISLIFEYDTIKIVSIKSKKVGLICRFVQLIVIAYVIGYVIIWKKGYQETDVGINGIISKVKGVSYTNRTGQGIVWDVADYVVPPQEDNAFFVTTNALITMKQTQGKCAEDINTEGARCTNDSDCKEFDPLLLGDGVKTGKCINNTICEVYAWCPVESSAEDGQTVKAPLLDNAFNFTILIKNNIEFPKFNLKRSNIPLEYDKAKLSSCRYDSVTAPKCPVFKIATILDLAKTNYNDIASRGGIISFTINWDCNLDVSVNKCFPTYKFNRLDVDTSTIASGWNFRHANYYYLNETQYRDLIKAYGIRFIISVSSKAGRFNIIPLTMNLGSGLALLGIATIICDFIVLYCLNNRQKYINAKYHRVTGEDPYREFNNDLESNAIEP